MRSILIYPILTGVCDAVAGFAVYSGTNNIALGTATGLGLLGVTVAIYFVGSEIIEAIQKKST